MSNQNRVFADEGCNSLLWTKATTFYKDNTKIIQNQGRSVQVAILLPAFQTMLSNQDRVFADEACNSLLWMKDTTFVKDSRAVKVLS